MAFSFIKDTTAYALTILKDANVIESVQGGVNVSIIYAPLKVSTIAASGGLVRVTTTTEHNIIDATEISIRDVLGTTEANGNFFAKKISATVIELYTNVALTAGVTFTNTYVSGGQVLTPLTDAAMTVDRIVVKSTHNTPSQSAMNFSCKTTDVALIGAVNPNTYTTQGYSSGYNPSQMAQAIQALSAAVELPVSIISPLGQSAMAASVPVVTSNDTLEIGCEITRPANTTAYAVLDAISTGFVITGATNATPIVITTSTAHGLVDGQPVYITGCVGNTRANNPANTPYFAKLTGYSTTTFGLYSDAALTTGVAGNGAWTSGGTVAAGLIFKGLPASCEGYISGARVVTTDTATATSSVVPLIQPYNNPVLPTADNGIWSLMYANATNRIRQIALNAFTTGGVGGASDGCAAGKDSFAVPFKADTNGYVYAILLTNTVFTPSANSTKFYTFLTFDISNIG